MLVASVMLVARFDLDGRLWRVLNLDGLLSPVITGLVLAIELARTSIYAARRCWRRSASSTQPWAALLT